MAEPFAVAIAGGGLGGLCLAHGLRAAGVPVTVYERDRSPDFRGQGYRIHIGPRGATALAQCLPPPLYELFLATAGSRSKQVTVATGRLRIIRVFPGDPHGDNTNPATVSTAVNRLTLREILLAGLGDTVRFGHEVTGFQTSPDGVVLRFAGGGSASADVLVGADGVGSPVRRTLLPHARVTDTGTRVLYGRTLLDDTTRALLPPQVTDGFLALRSFPRPVGMALGVVRPVERPEDAAATRWPGLRLSPCPDYLMWALTAPLRSFPGSDTALSSMDGVALRDTAARMIRRWHPQVRELVARCQAEENFHLPVRVAEPVAPWPAGPVTLLGDAVHAMSPSGGSGANTALRDAALLATRLSSAAHGELGLTAAIDGYQAEMLDHGFAVVRASLRHRTDLRH
jgi:2-polyprenyl-6-methoxyphenol hydroxylase-like FAD-dependent oxidoreductase